MKTLRLKSLSSFLSDIKSDWDSILRDELVRKGYDPSSFTNQTDLACSYSSIKARRIQSKPRTVILSSTFSIPQDLRTGFEQLKSKIENGDDINPYLSKSVFKLQKDDLMFYDWGIHHFHLGEYIEPDGFIKRTGLLAFGIVRPDSIYFISIEAHGAWSDKSLIEIVDRDWPELISSHRFNGGIEPNLTDEELGILRKAHVNTGIQLSNGHSYIILGGGYTSAGTSMEAMRNVTMVNHRFIDLYKDLEKATIKVSDGIPVEEFEVRIKRINDEIFAYSPILEWQIKFMNFLPLPT